jgi:hypothetical protein
MQIIAIGMVLLFGVTALLLSGLVGIIFGGLTATVVKGVSWQRRLAVSAASALPFTCLALIVIPFVLWRVVLARESFPGSCQLPNGYSLMMTDSAHPAWVYNPKNVSTSGSVDWQKDGVDNVRTLQVSSHYILGGRDSRGFDHAEKRVEGAVDSYFILDSETGELTATSSLEQLQAQASNLGIHLRLESAYTIYSRYGPLRLARIPTFIMLLISAALVGFLTRWIVQLRRLRSIQSASLATQLR